LLTWLSVGSLRGPLDREQGVGVSKPIRVILIVLAAVFLIVVLGGATAFFLGGRILAERMDLPDEDLVEMSDSATAARGEHLMTIWGCADCHTKTLGGKLLIDAGPFAYLVAPNLTSGIGGLTADYKLPTFERAVRHGVGWDGRLLMIMPVMNYRNIADADIAALFAYLKSVPAVDNDVVGRQLGPIGRFASLMAARELFPASAMMHDIVHLREVEPSMTADYGGYLAGVCSGCHGLDFSGIKDNGPNLTADPETGLGSWTIDDFRRAVRLGQRPDGTVLDSMMPWYVFDKMTNDEVEALWMFLQGLEPKAGR
jgi:mono/diheme cytochrome c family protein